MTEQAEQIYHWYYLNQIGPVYFGFARVTSSDGEWAKNGKAYRYRPVFSRRTEGPGFVAGWVNTANYYCVVIGWDK